MHLFGLDFSADQNLAGHKVWIAELIGHEDALHLARCDTLCGITGCPPGRDAAHAALVDWISARGPSVIGCDFPFGVPTVHLPPRPHRPWADWVVRFNPDPDEPLAYWAQAQQEVQRATEGGRRELRRATDTLTRTPMAPLNRRVFFQTFFGLRHVLRPLVTRGAATVAPMMPTDPGKPVLIEVCPGSLLKQHPALREACAAHGYKGRSPVAKRGRDAIVRQLQRVGRMHLTRTQARQLRQDPEGDALDAVLAAWCAWRHRDRLNDIPDEHRADALREGWVYV